jgi:crossover junction endodeoxyribonuclease RusA
MTDLRVTLPWPDRKLSPNARVHWAQKSKAVKTYRRTARLLTLSALSKTPERPQGAVDIDLAFYPPDRRRRDSDNLQASLKAGLDGIADALGIDDHQFRLSAEMMTDTQPGGAVVVTIRGRG